MAARLDGRDQQGLGSIAIPPKAGLDTLGLLMRSSDAQVGVFRHAQPADVPANDRFLDLLGQSSSELRHGMLETHIRALIASVMGKDPFQSAGHDASFFELGMDSLMSLDL